MKMSTSAACVGHNSTFTTIFLIFLLHMQCFQMLLWYQNGVQDNTLKENVEEIKEHLQPLLRFGGGLAEAVRTRRSASDSSSQQQEPSTRNVEFIHPKLRDEIGSDNEDPDNPWVWLTSYSRIPLEAIQDFCAATKEYCPPGKQGSKGDPGLPGLSGIKGKRGRPGRIGGKGSQGHRGPIGPPGPRGPKGENGIPGMQGLDGRDGLPGEPGLDGVPGRNGLDGVPGVDGIPGLPGSPGVPGTNGKDGEKGHFGSRGARGTQGERGLPGPRGRPGKDGEDGRPGKPGIKLWKINDKKMDSLLIPPSISGALDNEVDKTIIVKEGDHLKLTCAATGVPKPIIIWNRKDGNAFPDGIWRKSNSFGSTLNITRINRQHMGQYVCDANNGIPPAAKQFFNVEVHFPPLIRIHRQMVGGYNGSSVTLHCLIEAYPTAVNYWERHDGNLIQLQSNRKYRITIKEYDIYKTLLSLNITLESPADFGSYYCISKNEKGITKGGITLFQRDPNSSLPPPVIGGFRPSVIGEEAPEFASLDDLCPPSPKCQDCKAVRCEGSAKMYGLTILPYESSLPGLPNRTEECMIETIGKPVFHRYSGDLYGSWMMESSPLQPQDEDMANKIWVTLSNHNRTLFEFSNKTMYRANIPTRNHSLPLPFTGNDHVVFRSNFLYFHLASESIVRYNLLTKKSEKLKLPRNAEVISKGGNLITPIYRPQHDGSYFDFATDENGLWGIFGLALDNNTVVMKFDEELSLHFMWNISLNHHQIADMFIVCGVLYGVDQIDERSTRIRFALDLYKNKLLDIELPFSNPFSFTSMLGYNPRLQSLTTWDGGNQLTYPIKYHAIGYKEEKTEVPVDTTGFSLKSESDSGLQVIDMLEIE